MDFDTLLIAPVYYFRFAGAKLANEGDIAAVFGLKNTVLWGSDYILPYVYKKLFIRYANIWRSRQTLSEWIYVVVGLG